MNNIDLPLVSVIIPVYNNGCYIEACIQSVIHQTYQRIEIIIVNDCSTDNSSIIIERYRKSDSRIVCVSNSMNRGVALARESGFCKAKGKYIQYLDGDDTLMQDAICCLVRKAEEEDADIVVSPFFFCYPGKKPEHSMPLEFTRISNIEYLRKILMNRGYWSVWSHFQKRSFVLKSKVETVGGISIGEDAILMVQLILSASKIVSLDIPILNYNRDSSLISFLPGNPKYKDFRAYQMWIENYIESNGFREEFQMELARMHLQTTFQSLYWKQFDDFDKDMKRLIMDLKLYPGLSTSLSRRETKIVKTYIMSPYFGHLRLLYYCKRGKI
ncbi:MAG: glycosyltransferase [Bacteroides sp.]|jgi:glycosyltransferase involved in cell wall biosynthesis|nr:glycosyltransferase [Bacteroides sp.]MCI1682246.1 glycosyltransferase [Bacteroides sp.]